MLADWDWASFIIGILVGLGILIVFINVSD